MKTVLVDHIDKIMHILEINKDAFFLQSSEQTQWAILVKGTSTKKADGSVFKVYQQMYSRNGRKPTRLSLLDGHCCALALRSMMKNKWIMCVFSISQPTHCTTIIISHVSSSHENYPENCVSWRELIMELLNEPINIHIFCLRLSVSCHPIMNKLLCLSPKVAQGLMIICLAKQ